MLIFSPHVPFCKSVYSLEKVGQYITDVRAWKKVCYLKITKKKHLTKKIRKVKWCIILLLGIFELHWFMSGLGQYPVEVVKYSFKSPYFYVLNNEVFSLRKCMIPKRFTWMTSSMVEITIEPKSKLPSARQTMY